MHEFCNKAVVKEINEIVATLNVSRETMQALKK